MHNEGLEILIVFIMLINILYTVPYFILKHVYRNLKRVKDDFIYKSMQIINQYSPNMHIPDKVIPLYYHAFHNKLVENLDVKEMKKVFKLHRSGKINFYSYRLNRKTKEKTLKAKNRKQLLFRTISILFKKTST